MYSIKQFIDEEDLAAILIYELATKQKAGPALAVPGKLSKKDVNAIVKEHLDVASKTIRETFGEELPREVRDGWEAWAKETAQTVSQKYAR